MLRREPRSQHASFRSSGTKWLLLADGCYFASYYRSQGPSQSEATIHLHRSFFIEQCCRLAEVRMMELKNPPLGLFVSYSVPTSGWKQRISIFGETLCRCPEGGAAAQTEEGVRELPDDVAAVALANVQTDKFPPRFPGPSAVCGGTRPWPPL
jgi:hypothetical protein